MGGCVLPIDMTVRNLVFGADSVCGLRRGPRSSIDSEIDRTCRWSTGDNWKRDREGSAARRCSRHVHRIPGILASILRWGDFTVFCVWDIAATGEIGVVLASRYAEDVVSMCCQGLDWRSLGRLIGNPVVWLGAKYVEKMSRMNRWNFIRSAGIGILLRPALWAEVAALRSSR